MLPLIPQPAWIPPRSLRGATSFQVPLLFPRSRALSLLSPNISCLPLHFHTGSTAGATDFRSIPTLNAQFMDPWRDPPLLQVSTFALGSRKSWLTTAFTSESKSPPPLQGETRVFFKAEVERVSARSQRKCRGTVEKAVRKGVQRVRWKSEE